ncbi:MAG TPA: hypothetical protein VF210_04030 [Pseudomonadales bacterium]
MNRSRIRRTLAASAIVLLVATTLPAQHHAVPPPPVGGRLAESALLGGHPLTAADLSPDLASADRMRLQAYLNRRNGFEPRSGGEAHRIRFEQELVSIVETTGIEDEAAELARQLPPAAQWGDPEREAEWAEAMLRSRPASPAAPYLYAFLASRYRQIFERLPEDDRAALERQARKYRTLLERARAAMDPIFALLAADLDGLPSLGHAARHPRAYLPDT